MEQMKVTAEVCPHHFTLTSDDIHKIEPSIDQEKKLAIDADADTNFKMNPPLRSREDVQALKEGLRDNIMDVISTDHAPHTFEEKNTSMKKRHLGSSDLRQPHASLTRNLFCRATLHRCRWQRR